jgi:formylglycine-generating enzyme required for sulfatase activity
LNITILRFAFALVIVGILASAADAVTIATVPVGSPGNAPDPATGSLYGAVPYNYRIGTYDVTNAQYVEFLNAKASAADPYGLWNSSMAPGNFEGAISRLGSGPYSYSVKPGFQSKPAIYISWDDAIRFANWLTNGQGGGDTESGSYTIGGGGTPAETVAVPNATQRAMWAATSSFHWLLPSENEWYKAAYYNAPNNTYFAYPFQSDSEPIASTPPGGANVGNFYDNGYPAYNYDGNGSYLTDVGAYPSSLSPSGSLDMGGDVFQWNETFLVDHSRGLRGGGAFVSPSGSAASLTINFAISGAEEGFRLVTVGGVPEPGSVALALIGVAGLALRQKRFRACDCRFAGGCRVSGG